MVLGAVLAEARWAVACSRGRTCELRRTERRPLDDSTGA